MAVSMKSNRVEHTENIPPCTILKLKGQMLRDKEKDHLHNQQHVANIFYSYLTSQKMDLQTRHSNQGNEWVHLH